MSPFEGRTRERAISTSDEDKSSGLVTSPAQARSPLNPLSVISTDTSPISYNLLSLPRRDNGGHLSPNRNPPPTFSDGEAATTSTPESSMSTPGSGAIATANPPPPDTSSSSPLPSPTTSDTTPTTTSSTSANITSQSSDASTTSAPNLPGGTLITANSPSSKPSSSSGSTVSSQLKVSSHSSQSSLPTSLADNDPSPGASSTFRSKLFTTTSTNVYTDSGTLVTTTAVETITSGVSSSVTSAAPVSEISRTTNGKDTAIIAGVVGGVGGLILLVTLGLFFCVRRRRRRHATPLDWEAVRTSVFRSPSNPRTPRSIHSVHSDAPLSAPMSQVTDTSSQYATAQENAYSPTRPGTARTNISPLLIVQTPPRSEESYHAADEEHDPFADPLAMARLRPRILNASPTIRVSDTTLVDQAWAGKGTAYKMEGLSKDVIQETPDELLMPPPPLNPAVGRPNRLSNDSFGPVLQDEDSAAGLAM